MPDIEELERQFAGTPSDVSRSAAFTNATVTITRNAAADVQDWTVTLWLDDERWDVLRYGQTLTRIVQPGRHFVKAHNTLIATTFEFDASPGERVRLRCANTMARGGALRSLLVDVSPYDALAFTAAPALLIAAIVAACLAPALRATRVDPMVELRRE